MPLNPETASDLAAGFADQLPDDFPNLRAMAEMVVGQPDAAGADFEFGLDLLLDGLDRLLRASGQ
jgi:hypothetical protein